MAIAHVLDHVLEVGVGPDFVQLGHRFAGGDHRGSVGRQLLATPVDPWSFDGVCSGHWVGVDVAANGTSDTGAVAGVANHAAPAAATGKLNVFISYSRADETFADELYAGLVYSGYPCELDRHSIRQGEDWKLRLGALIAAADTVVFVLSPDSARSEVCQWEVEHAHALAKRIIPVLWRGLHERPRGKRADGSAWPEGPVNGPPRLAALNYVRFDDHDDGRRRSFMAGLKGLVQSLEDDLDWLRAHSRLLTKAREWEEGGRAINRLLSGTDVAAAKALIDRRKPTAPSFTDLQLDLIKASEKEEARKAEEARSAIAERERLASEREAAARRAEEEAKLSEAQMFWLLNGIFGCVILGSFIVSQFGVDRFFLMAQFGVLFGLLYGNFHNVKVVRRPLVRIYQMQGFAILVYTMLTTTELRAISEIEDLDPVIPWLTLIPVELSTIYLLARRRIGLPWASIGFSPNWHLLKVQVINLADAVVCASVCFVWANIWNAIGPLVGARRALPLDLTWLPLLTFVVFAMLLPIRYVFLFVGRRADGPAD